MSNVNDYLVWRGDIPITKDFPFNEIDNLVLARFSYLIFNKINMEKEETIESISLKMKDFPNDDFRYNGDKEFITNLGVSTRFKNMIVTDFIEKSDKSAEKQFGAITIHISNKEMYISFIGTDSTLVGWKEDFNLAFMKNIPAQIDGMNYLNNVAKKYSHKTIRVGGHSKGGNVAIYSAISVAKQIQNRIISVRNYDGPGFNSAIIDTYKDEDIINRIVTFIPEDSVIGRILEHEEKVYVVESIEKGIYQHDIYSWQVLGKDFVYANAATNSSEVMYKAIKEWLKQTTPDQRRIFFDGVFEVFFSTSANTFGEISRNFVKNAPTLFKSYKDISEEDKKTMNLMLKKFVKAYTATLKQSEKFKIDLFEKNL